MSLLAEEGQSVESDLNLICSVRLSEPDLEEFNVGLNEKYRLMTENEQRSESFHTDDAEWLIVACNTPSRMAKGAVDALRRDGIRAGLFRPVTLWPFPIDALVPLLDNVRGIVVVEAGPGQLENEMRLALSHAGVDRMPPIHHVQHYGGVLPELGEIVNSVVGMQEVEHV